MTFVSRMPAAAASNGWWWRIGSDAAAAKN
jgi:hypothetical protein